MFNFSAFIPGSFLWTGCLCTVPGVSRLIGRGVVGSLVPIMDCPLSDPEDIFFRQHFSSVAFVQVVLDPINVVAFCEAVEW